MPVKYRINNFMKGKGALLLLSLVLLLTMAVSGTAAFVVTRTQPVQNRFVSGLSTDGSLVIRKTLEHPFGPDYAVPENEHTAFTFTVDLGAANAGHTFGAYTADENGVVTLTLRPDGSAALTDIPEGTTVTVAEPNPGDGFAPLSAQTVTIPRADVATVCFENVYTPGPAAPGITVEGVKTLVGRDWQEGDSYTFRLEYRADDEWTPLGDRTITAQFDTDEETGETTLNEDSLRFDFSDLVNAVPFDAAGTYAFRVTEVEGTIGGVTYDESVSRFDVLVGDADMDGTLEVQSIETASENTTVDGGHVLIAFENRYAPEGSVEVFIEIEKTLDDRSGQGLAPAGFVFELRGEDGEIAATATTDSLGEASIRLIMEPDSVGEVYHYTLSERNDEAPGMTYDDTEIELYIAVLDNYDGTISAFIYDADQRAEANEAEITNVDGSYTPALDGVLYSVRVRRADAVRSVADVGVSEMATRPVTASAYDDLIEDVGVEDVYTEPEYVPETYTEEYTEPETAEDFELVEITEAGEVTAEEEVIPEEEIVLPAIPEDATNVYHAAFRNVYDPEDATVTVTAAKRLSGRALHEGEFSFLLYETGADYATDDGPETFLAAVNDAFGAVTFDELTFTETGVYHYVVEESADAAIPGVSYDARRFYVTVTVTDEGGVLAASWFAADELGEPCEIVFDNTYTPTMASLTLTGEKVLVNRALMDGEFSFSLYECDADYVIRSAALRSVTNDGNGLFRFDDLLFSEAGTRYFVVREDNGRQTPGVEYDPTAYHIEVTVTDSFITSFLQASNIAAC